MKLILFLIAIVFSSNLSNGQGLNSEAIYIKDNFPEEYENTLKRYALFEWKDDFSMVVYEINRQAESIVELVDSFDSDNTNIVYNAIQEWSRSGYLSKNIKIFSEMTDFSVKYLIKMHCDWSMVKYEYDRQVEAKNSF
ncbi:hypothetical protein [Ravibacter arvi]